MPTLIQTKRDIEAILTGAGLRPDKHLGQHFLIDGNLMRKLVAAAEIAPDDVVLEVGGGTGGLTDVLAETASQVVVVEVDHDLAPLLTQRYADKPHVKILHTDVLANKSTIAPEVLDTLTEAQNRAVLDVPDSPCESRMSRIRKRAEGETPNEEETQKAERRRPNEERLGKSGEPDDPPASAPRILLVANLPYHVATPLLMNLLTATPRIERFVFTIQQEVADRLDAVPGSRDYGPLAIAIQTACHITRIAKLPPQAFWPPPKVASSMIRLDRQPHAFEDGDQLGQFIKLLRAAFAHRRKTVRYNLTRYLTEATLAHALDLIDGNERAERIEMDIWLQLGQRLFVAPSTPENSS